MPMYDAMTPKPRNAAPYNAIRPKVSMTAINPNTAANRARVERACRSTRSTRSRSGGWTRSSGDTSTARTRRRRRPGRTRRRRTPRGRDQSGDEALGHPGRIAQKLRSAFRHSDGGGN